MLPSFSKTATHALRHSLPLAFLLLWTALHSALAQTGEPPVQPILRVETGTHTAQISHLSVDAQSHYLATSSDDKTIRLWNAVTGAPLAVLRPPIGEGKEGFSYTVAVSPDGRTIGCGGWTGYQWDQTDSVYLFDRVSGKMRARIAGLPGTINYMVYSPDGRTLAIFVGDGGGLRLYRTADNVMIGQDTGYDYGGGIAFSSDSSRLVTASTDGNLRLYALRPDSDDVLHLVKTVKSPTGGRPFAVAFSPDSTRIAVNSNDTNILAVLSAQTLATLYEASTGGLQQGSMIALCWSADGRSLYAGGGSQNGGKCLIRRWSDAGQGISIDLPLAPGEVTSLAPRLGGGVFFAQDNSTLGLADAQNANFTVPPTILDFRVNPSGFLVSDDGGRIQFTYPAAKLPILPPMAVFSVMDHKLVPNGDSSALHPIISYADSWSVQAASPEHPAAINGNPLPMQAFESVIRYAFAPDRQSLMLGTNYYLHRFDKNGQPLWPRPVSTPAFCQDLNVSGDGRVAVAAFGDGTIRWYRMTDGQELLAFFPHADHKRWVAWTPSGYYDCSPNDDNLIGWHLNHKAGQAADFFSASRFSDIFHRPDVIARVLTTLDERLALNDANTASGRKEQSTDIQKNLPPVVAILSPPDGTVPTGSTLTLRYTLRAPSGEPITDVVAQVDGRPVLSGHDLHLQPADSLIDQMTIPLPLDARIVSLLAFNAHRASDPATIHLFSATRKQTEAVNPEAPAAFSLPPKLYLLAVGISQYQDSTLELTYPAKDAHDFVHAMQAQTGRLYKQVVVYSDKEVTNGAATKGAIEDGLQWLKKQTTTNDVAMIFLSGHGNLDSDGKYYFLPADFDRKAEFRTGLYLTDITLAIQAIKGKVIVFNDSCHAGGIGGGATKGLASESDAVSELARAENGAVVFSAATGTESALEDSKWNNGAFTKALVEGMNGQAEYAHTGYISVDSMTLYLDERVKELTDGRQHPTGTKPPAVRDFPIALTGQAAKLGQDKP